MGAVMPKLDIEKAPVKTGSTYPAPFDQQMLGRSSCQLGTLGGLSQFGVNLVTLQPGAKSSLRHWHEEEDEFAMVIEGVLWLVEDAGEWEMGAGECVAWPAGKANGHHLVNRSDRIARFLVVGTQSPNERATYTEVDMKVSLIDGRARFTRRDGSPLHEDPAQR